ncbi:MAG: DnaJ domain-containing protein [Chloroflexota bacterium]
MNTSTNTHNWLRQKIKTLPSIRNVHRSIDTPADLIVRTWVGMSVNIYLLDGVPNLRAIKRLLQDNTRAYQASLFVLHHQLLPPDKKRLIPDDWMYALHELNSERIYTYIPDEEGLQQVHFDYMPDGVEREVWHGGDVTFEKLRVLNVSAKTRAIRGQYMMADFGANPYWRTSEKRAERLRARFNHGPQHYTWTRYDAGAMPGGADNESLRRAHMSELERCCETLGVPVNASQDEVKAAFRKLAREFHPDVSDLDKDEAEARFREINVAYETIKTKKQWS